MLIVRRFRLLLEDAVQEVLELIATRVLSISFVFHWGQYNVHRIDLFEFARTDHRMRDLCAILHVCWHHGTNLALPGAVSISDGAKRR